VAYLLIPVRCAIIVAALATGPTLAQTKQKAPAEASNATEATLAVGALQIGSADGLQVAGFDIAVDGGSVVYSYYLANKGPAELAVTAALSLPELVASADGSETWTLARNDPENFVDLSVSVGGSSVPTKTTVRATALSVDRLAEIQAEHLPALPFGAATDKALAALSPEAADRLAALGIVSLRDPAQPKARLVADWSLEVVHSWRLTLPAGKTTAVVIKFAPIAAHYRMAKGDEDDVADLKDEVCLKPQALTMLQARLKGNGAWKVTDISLSADAPSKWLDNPAATISVQKPRGDTVVSFCGMDEKTAGKAAVLGTAPESEEGVRILIFEPAK
jgi:hypothetical protein